ncbi:MAG: hypothetical protein WBF40_06795, partial [Methyloceanibacter sp.]
MLMTETDLIRAGSASSDAKGAPTTRLEQAPQGDDEGNLYVSRVKIYPKRAHGKFRTAKWIVMA